MTGEPDGVVQEKAAVTGYGLRVAYPVIRDTPWTWRHAYYTIYWNWIGSCSTHDGLVEFHSMLMPRGALFIGIGRPQHGFFTQLGANQLQADG